MPSSVRCILIDNDPSTLERLGQYIERIPFLDCTGRFDDPFAALDFLMKNPVELVLTGVEMNGIDGFQLISSLSSPPMVIFVAAHGGHAVEAFARDAVDYLLKPVAFERLLKAAGKAYRTFFQRGIPPENRQPVLVPAFGDHLFVKTENRLIRVPFDEMVLIEGYGDYIKIHLRDGRVLLSLQNMGHFEKKLPAADFARVHRSWIVAIDKIDEIERKRIRIGKQLIPVSEGYQEGFLAKINQ